MDTNAKFADFYDNNEVAEQIMNLSIPEIIEEASAKYDITLTEEEVQELKTKLEQNWTDRHPKRHRHDYIHWFEVGKPFQCPKCGKNTCERWTMCDCNQKVVKEEWYECTSCDYDADVK